jgi:hypothetical protein
MKISTSCVTDWHLQTKFRGMFWCVSNLFVFVKLTVVRRVEAIPNTPVKWLPFVDPCPSAVVTYSVNGPRTPYKFSSWMTCEKLVCGHVPTWFDVDYLTLCPLKYWITVLSIDLNGQACLRIYCNANLNYPLEQDVYWVWNWWKDGIWLQWN